MRAPTDSGLFYEIKSMGVTVIRTSELELLYKLAAAADAGDPGDPGDLAKAVTAWKVTLKDKK